MKKYWILVILPLICLACQPESQQDNNVSAGSSTLPIEYATGFSASQENGYWQLTIHHPYPEAKRPFTYLLVPENMPVPDHPAATQIIRTPISRLIATSTTHIPLLDYLQATNALVGFPNPDYISSEKMRARIDEGKVVNVGMDKALELESIMALTPDLIMSYSLSSDIGQLERLRKAGIPYLLNADYLESHPLGRAEWIKVAGLLLDRTRMADSVFNEIKKYYLELTDKVAQVEIKPTALSGIVYGDSWFMPGGENYAAGLMKDAAIQYLWGDNTSAGFLELSFESVLKKAQEADLWIGVASFNSLDALAAAEPRYKNFKAFREGNVFTYNRRIGATGGNEYLELGYLRPDLILGDLVHIAHPDLLPEHSMYFYRRLE